MQSPSHSPIWVIARSARAALFTSTISLRPASSTLAKTGVPSSMVVTKARLPLVACGFLFFVAGASQFQKLSLAGSSHCAAFSLRIRLLPTTPFASGKTIRWNTRRSEEHTSELQSLMRISYAVFCLKKKKQNHNNQATTKHKSSTHSEKEYTTSTK